jgi:hypothetical protein
MLCSSLINNVLLFCHHLRRFAHGRTRELCFKRYQLKVWHKEICRLNYQNFREEENTNIYKESRNVWQQYINKIYCVAVNVAYLKEVRKAK